MGPTVVPEAFPRAGTRDTAAWQALVDRRRAGCEGYCAAVREDLALPPGHPARRPLSPALRNTPDQR
ncbi:hypothetical protein ACI2L1_17820 [Streptomyces sp. NPDC019531]|uniref:hypothetical protein n=1 Tax=Streptomyces sp. NPDC019531 TaxID=3365062 RepID=UPI00384E93C7